MRDRVPEMEYFFCDTGAELPETYEYLSLLEAGVGLPTYYQWRTRSGCYFCFFQRKHEWVGLADRHPELFQRAIAYEDKVSYEATAMQGRDYTWSHDESLKELLARRQEI